MIRSIFTRDKPGTSDPAVAEAMADAELKFGDSVPTGPYLDMTTRLPVVDPLKIKSPVLIARENTMASPPKMIYSTSSKSCRRQTGRSRFCPERRTLSPSASIARSSGMS